MKTCPKCGKRRSGTVGATIMTSSLTAGGGSSSPGFAPGGLFTPAISSFNSLPFNNFNSRFNFPFNNRNFFYNPFLYNVFGPRYVNRPQAFCSRWSAPMVNAPSALMADAASRLASNGDAPVSAQGAGGATYLYTRENGQIIIRQCIA